MMRAASACTWGSLPVEIDWTSNSRNSFTRAWRRGIAPRICSGERLLDRCTGALPLRAITGLHVYQFPPSYIGHLLDTDPVVKTNSLKSLARPTGIEPVFPP